MLDLDSVKNSYLFSLFFHCLVSAKERSSVKVNNSPFLKEL